MYNVKKIKLLEFRIHSLRKKKCLKYALINIQKYYIFLTEL